MPSFPPPHPLSSHAQRMNQLGMHIDRVVAVERDIARLHGQRARLIEQCRVLSAEDADANVAESTAPARQSSEGWSARNVARRELVSELACALRLPQGSADRLVEESRALLCDVPHTLEALSLGLVSYRHAVKLIDHARSLPEDALSAFEEAVLPFAKALTVAKFDQRARTVRELTHPESLEKRAVAARTERSVVVEPGRDGMAWLMSYLPAEVAIAGHNRLTDIAASLQCPSESRSLAQLRADVLGDLLIDGSTEAINESEPELIELSDQNLEVIRSLQAVIAEMTGEFLTLASVTVMTAHNVSTTDAEFATVGTSTGTSKRSVGKVTGIDRGVRATVMVTVPAMTLLDRGDQPAILEGYGPIDRDTARELAAGAPSFIRLLTHPETGAVLSVGRDAYSPPQDLRRWLTVRDATCRFPGCSRRARRCEVDHTVDWAVGGETTHDNLAHLCKGDHNLKHHTAWQVRHRARGTLEWTSPTGHTYLTEPDVRLGAVTFRDLGIEAPT